MVGRVLIVQGIWRILDIIRFRKVLGKALFRLSINFLISPVRKGLSSSCTLTVLIGGKESIYHATGQFQ